MFSVMLGEGHGRQRPDERRRTAGKSSAWRKWKASGRESVHTTLTRSQAKILKEQNSPAKTRSLRRRVYLKAYSRGAQDDERLLHHGAPAGFAPAIVAGRRAQNADGESRRGSTTGRGAGESP